MVAAIAVLIKDTGKLTLGQPLTILTPHAVEALVKQPPDRWLSNSHMTHYQALLLDAEQVQFGPVVALNPATLLPLPEEAEQHDCLQILTEVHKTRPDLSDQPLQNADHTWYTDDNSFLAEGEQKAGAAVTTEDKVIWAKALPAGTSAQRAELIALTQALKMTKVFVDTFSRWVEAFPTKHETTKMVTKKLLEEIFPSPSLRAHLQALQIVQRDVWRPLAAAYQDKLEHPVVPHPFQIGDTVWVHRHQTKNLEPR
ncbi:uncharacterized protein LOC134479945 isoform X2 [Rattus norvegicus]|uniref:uncharacterized protein LOC134479945 isoform X2 n=1 Tax=Rattus norvegicus TaxID=10116 RepID=UPI002FD7DF99